MADAAATPQWIDVSQADDIRDVIHRGVACLCEAGVVGLATETVYGLAASALNARGVARVRALRRPGATRPLTLLLKGPEEITDWVPGISQVGRRMAWRLWPGPATLVFSGTMTNGLYSRLPAESRSLISPDGDIALRSPAHPIVREVLRLMPGPLVISMVATPENPIPSTAESLRGLAGVDMVDRRGTDPVPEFRHRRPNRRRSLEHRTTGCHRRRHPRRDVQPDHPVRLHGQHLPQPHGRGDLQDAAGATAGLPDRRAGTTRVRRSIRWRGSQQWLPAATNAVDVVRALGGSLENHRSRRIAASFVRQADCIFAMTADHLDDLLASCPSSIPARSCSTPPAATWQTPSAAISRPTAGPHE